MIRFLTLNNSTGITAQPFGADRYRRWTDGTPRRPDLGRVLKQPTANNWQRRQGRLPLQQVPQPRRCLTDLEKSRQTPTDPRGHRSRIAATSGATERSRWPLQRDVADAGERPRPSSNPPQGDAAWSYPQLLDVHRTPVQFRAVPLRSDWALNSSIHRWPNLRALHGLGGGDLWRNRQRI